MAFEDFFNEVKWDLPPFFLLQKEIHELKKPKQTKPTTNSITSFSLLLPEMLFQTEHWHFCLGVGQHMDVWPMCVCLGSNGAMESWQQGAASACWYGLGKMQQGDSTWYWLVWHPWDSSALGSPLLPAFPSPEK